MKFIVPILFIAESLTDRLGNENRNWNETWLKWAEQCHRFELINDVSFIDGCASANAYARSDWIAVRKLNSNGSQVACSVHVGRIFFFIRRHSTASEPANLSHIRNASYQPTRSYNDDDYYFLFCVESFFVFSIVAVSGRNSSFHICFFPLLLLLLLHDAFNCVATTSICFHLLKCRSILQANRAVNICSSTANAFRMCVYAVQLPVVRYKTESSLNGYAHSAERREYVITTFTTEKEKHKRSELKWRKTAQMTRSVFHSNVVSFSAAATFERIAHSTLCKRNVPTK